MELMLVLSEYIECLNCLLICPFPVIKCGKCLSCIGNLIEKIVFNHFSLEKKLVERYHSGFQAGHSTVFQLDRKKLDTPAYFMTSKKLLIEYVIKTCTQVGVPWIQK